MDVGLKKTNILGVELGCWDNLSRKYSWII
jgi:hypothetical protein